MDELIKNGKNLNSKENLSAGEINESQNDELAKRDRAKLAMAYNNFDVDAQAEKMPEPLAIAIKEESAMKEALSNYSLENGQIVDKRAKKVAIKNPNKISESEKNALLMQFGGVIDKSGNLTLGSGESKFTLITNAGSMRKDEKKESTYSMSSEEQEKLKKSIDSNNKTGFDIGNIKADFKFTDGSSYEGSIGLGMRKIHEKGQLAIKAHFKKLIEIAERNHGIWLEGERAFCGEFQKLAGGAAFALGDKTILKLSVQDLRKLENVSLEQFGTKSFMGHQFSTAAELVHKMDGFLREMSLSVIHSQSGNHEFGILGSQVINDPAFKQYIEYYGYFQGATRDEAKAKFDFELNRRLKLSVGGGIERIVYNKLGKNVIGDKIETPNNTKIGPTGELSLTWQPEGDRVRITPGVKASSTIREVGIGSEVMVGKGVSAEGKIGYTQHVGTNRPSDLTGYAGFNRMIGSDKDKFDPLFEPSFVEKTKELYQSVLNLRNRPLAKNQIIMLADVMKGRPISSLIENEDFIKSLKLIADKLGVNKAILEKLDSDGIAVVIHMIDYQSRTRFSTAILPDKYKDGQFLFEGPDKKSKELYSSLVKLDNNPISKSEIFLLRDAMKGRKIEILSKVPSFTKSLSIIGSKLGLSSIDSKLSTPEGIAITILMIDYKSRTLLKYGFLPERYKELLQLSVEELDIINLSNTPQLTNIELDKINQARKGVTLADLQTQMHGENIYGRGFVDKVSIWKYNKGAGIAENADGSLDITTSSITLIVGSNASLSNPSGLTDLFKVTSATTIHITLEQIKELHRRAGAANVNLNFPETGGTFFNLNLAITKGSIHFTTNKQISRMPSDLSIEMVNNRINNVILTSILAGQLTIATAADMVFNRGDFTTALVNRFINGQYSYLVMNGIKAGTYSAADIAKLQAGTLTNAEAETLLTASAPTTAPGSFAIDNSTDTGPSNNDGYTKSQPKYTWTASATATSYEITSNGGTSWTDIGNVLLYQFSGLTDGAYNIKVRAKNAVGTGPETAVSAITLDTVTPSGIPAFVGTTPDTKLTAYTGLALNFSENLTGGSISSITSSNGGAISNISINGSGNVAFDWTSPNAGGTTFTITGTDKAGNAFSITKNVTLPNAPGGAPTSAPGSFAIDSSTDAGPSNSDGYTKSQPKYTWTASATATSYEITSNGGTSWTDIGNVLLYQFSGLADGAYNIKVRAKNASGVGPETAASVINLNSVALSDPSVLSGDPIIINTTYDMEISAGKNLTGGSISCSVEYNNGTSWVAGGGNIVSANINGSGNMQISLTTGSYSQQRLVIQAQDKYGNAYSTTKYIAFNTLAGVPPTMLSIPDQSLVAGSAFNLGVSTYATPTNGDSITGYSITSGSLPSGISLNTTTGAITGTPTSVGVYNATLVSTDKDGTSNSINVKLTVNFPTATTESTAATIQGTAYPLLVSYTGVSLTGGTITGYALQYWNGSARVTDNGQWNTSPYINGAGKIAGNYNAPANTKMKINITGITKNGVSADYTTGDYNLTSPDTTPPTTPTFTITEGNYTKNLAINLSVNANADVAGWYVSESSSAPAAGDAGWTSSAPTGFTLSSSDGAHTVYVYAKDAAGNVQSTGGTKVITLDTVVPSGTPSFVGTTPDTKLTSYSGLALNFSENLTGGNISSITSSNGGAISNISINGAGNVVFDWSSPNAGGTTFTITGTDRAGNAFSLTKNVTLPN